MEFQDLIRQRYSVRAYRPDPVAEDTLDRVLEAARLAPTAANRQPFGLVVYPIPGNEAQVQRIYHREWILQAPLLVCVCGVPLQAWQRTDGKLYLDVDAAIVMDHLVLAATDAGLGTCWVASLNAPAACEVFGLPEYVEPIALTPLGYPADSPRPKERKPLSELVHYGQW